MFLSCELWWSGSVVGLCANGDGTFFDHLSLTYRNGYRQYRALPTDFIRVTLSSTWILTTNRHASIVTVKNLYWSWIYSPGMWFECGVSHVSVESLQSGQLECKWSKNLDKIEFTSFKASQLGRQTWPLWPSFLGLYVVYKVRRTTLFRSAVGLYSLNY